MPIDSRTAAEVARRHGLDLGDAVALQRLADTTDEANELAEQFAAPPEDGLDADRLAKSILNPGGDA